MSCFVRGCKREPGNPCYRLTKSRYISWMTAIGLDPKEQSEDRVSRERRICSNHFSDKNYDVIRGVMRLKDDAVPDINLPDSKIVYTPEHGSTRTSKMEEIKYFNSILKKYIKVFVPSDVAKRCREDPAYAGDLFSQLQDQGVEEGSTVEIDTVASEVENLDEECTKENVSLPVLEEADIKVEDNPIKLEDNPIKLEDTTSKSETVQSSEETQNYTEGSTEDKLWSRKDTLLMLKVYKRLRDKYKAKFSWIKLSEELRKKNVRRTRNQCKDRWSNLLRAYNHSPKSGKFPYFKEVQAILNERPLSIPEISDSDEGQSQFTWSMYDTFKLLKAFYKHRNIRSSFSSEDEFWEVISNDLAKQKVVINGFECSDKWKKLYRQYKVALRTKKSTSFKFYNQINDIVNDREPKIPDVLNLSSSQSELEEDQSDDSPDEHQNTPDVDMLAVKQKLDKPDSWKVSWTMDETLKLIEAFKNYKNRLNRNRSHKAMWSAIAAELASKGVVDKGTGRCQSKWRTLMKSYGGNNKQFYFTNALDEVFNEDVSTTQNGETSKMSLDDNSEMDVTTSLPSDNDTANYHDSNSDTNSNRKNRKPDSVDNSWSYNEACSLIKAYGRHKNKFKNANAKCSTWKVIADNLQSIGIQKSAENCEEKWKNLYLTYNAIRNCRAPAKRFPLFTVIKNTLDNDESEFDGEVNDDKDVKDSSQYLSKKTIEKNKRHSERMVMMKRKLLIEERKVKAFEDYVEHFKKTNKSNK